MEGASEKGARVNEVVMASASVAAFLPAYLERRWPCGPMPA